MIRGLIPIVLSALLISSASVTALSYNSQKEEASVELLFIQTAKEAVISKNRSQPGKWVLTLKGVEPEISYFSDRPNRISGKTSVQTFLNEWSRGSHSFKSDNPNASLVTHISHSTSSDAQENMIVLSNPRYDSRRNTITYDIEGINGASGNFEEGSHKDPVLFIDSSCFVLC